MKVSLSGLKKHLRSVYEKSETVRKGDLLSKLKGLKLKSQPNVIEFQDFYAEWLLLDQQQKDRVMTDFEKGLRNAVSDVFELDNQNLRGYLFHAAWSLSLRKENQGRHWFYPEDFRAEWDRGAISGERALLDAGKSENTKWGQKDRDTHSGDALREVLTEAPSMDRNYEMSFIAMLSDFYMSPDACRIVCSQGGDHRI
ncbi:hypothetical protein FOL47_006210 [Perkinsus chesapeaki]|uniref:Uncharacterized protein n=1 Tax=Perkinsus chesapeaki TaxID=330153 RepID=A0A7J6LTP7_PERCH|nr:hypothetical protein FOL47_006210 [Perkinsus chesapeaki]